MGIPKRLATFIKVHYNPKFYLNPYWRSLRKLQENQTTANRMRFEKRLDKCLKSKKNDFDKIDVLENTIRLAPNQRLEAQLYERLAEVYSRCSMESEREDAYYRAYERYESYSYAMESVGYRPSKDDLGKALYIAAVKLKAKDLVRSSCEQITFRLCDSDASKFFASLFEISHLDDSIKILLLGQLAESSKSLPSKSNDFLVKEASMRLQKMGEWKYAQKAAEELEQKQYPALAAQLHKELSSYFTKNSRFEEALDCANKSFELDMTLPRDYASLVKWQASKYQNSPAELGEFLDSALDKISHYFNGVDEVFDVCVQNKDIVRSFRCLQIAAERGLALEDILQNEGKTILRAYMKIDPVQAQKVTEKLVKNFGDFIYARYHKYDRDYNYNNPTYRLYASLDSESKAALAAHPANQLPESTSQVTIA